MLVIVLLVIAVPLGGTEQRPEVQGQARTDEYARFDLLDPDTNLFRIEYEVSATTAGARSFVDPIPSGVAVSGVAAYDLMTSAPLKVEVSAGAIRITLARPVPKDGQGRLGIVKTYKDPKSY
jgi:hypothetical protein